MESATIMPAFFRIKYLHGNCQGMAVIIKDITP